LISEEKQTSTLTAVASSTVYVLGREAIQFQRLTREDPFALWVLARIAIGHLCDGVSFTLCHRCISGYATVA